MKNNFLKSLLITAIMSAGVCVSQLNAQIQFGIHGSRLISERGDWGGGVFFKGFVGDNLAAGASVKVYPKRFSTETKQYGNTNYRQSQGDLFIPVTGSLDIFLTNGLFRPYIGSDVGLYYNKYFYRLDNDTDGQNIYSYDRSKSYFGVGPRFGFAVQSGIIGLFAQFQYNYLFGTNKQGELFVPGINSNVTINPIRSFTSVDVGVYFRIGGDEN